MKNPKRKKSSKRTKRIRAYRAREQRIGLEGGPDSEAETSIWLNHRERAIAAQRREARELG